MPTATASELVFAAASLGPALSPPFSGAARQGRAAVRVHSVFRSALNLEVEGGHILAALTGPAGEDLPHAVVLGRDTDFRDWPLETGDRGSYGTGAILIEGAGGRVRVDLAGARRFPAAVLPRIAYPGAAFASCVATLAGIQAGKACDLRIDCLLGGGRAPGPLGSRLSAAAMALGEASARPAGAGGKGAPLPVARLVGLGQGLTPSGDDFLCGFLAAARCAAPDLEEALGEAVEESLGSTNAISASLLRCAVRGLFPRSLAGAALAISTEDAPAAVDRIRRCCALGHGSGADLATGLLFGVAVLADGGKRRTYAS